MSKNPLGDDYDDLLGSVDTSPDQNWETSPMLNPSSSFQYLGSKATVVPWDFSTDLDRGYGEGPIPWTDEIKGDIVLRPDVLERSPADTSTLEERSLDEGVKVPIRFREQGVPENEDETYERPPYIGFLQTGDIEEEVSVRTTQEGMRKLNLGKKYDITILPNNYQRNFT